MTAIIVAAQGQRITDRDKDVRPRINERRRRDPANDGA